VLKPGGRFAIQDMAIRGVLPEEIRRSAESWAGCIAGALDIDDYLGIVKAVGFHGVATKQITEYDFARTEEYAILSVGLVGRK